MNNLHNNRGYTLTELMITVGIIGIMSAIALPAYNSYIATSKLGTARSNAVTLSTFEDTYFYENEGYLAGSYIPGGTDNLTAALEWAPSGDRDNFSYVVTAGPCGDITQCYTITVTMVDDAAITTSISRP
jgi:prepilin-type N-terminal cleavage/methylation domain-containing protein